MRATKQSLFGDVLYIYFAAQGGSKFWVYGQNRKIENSVLFGALFEFTNEILKCDHSNKSCWALLYRSNVGFGIDV